MNTESDPKSTEDPQSDDSPNNASELEKLRNERDRYLAQLQRSQADFQNLKKRTASDIELAVKRTLTPLFDQILLALDSLELALGASSEQKSELAAGVRLTRDKLLRGLELAGVQRMAPSEQFDPLRQEAVATQFREDVEPGYVLEVLREGYTFQGQVLRAAQVRVAARPPRESDSSAERGAS